jgi:type I restriction enzyme, S subunit
MRGLTPYSDYQTVEVPWLKSAPSHWEVLRGKWLFVYRKELNTNRLNTNILSLTLRGVVNNDPNNPEGLVPKDYASYQIFRKNDLVFKLIDLENIQTSRVGLVHEDGIMSPAYLRLSLQKTGNIKFFFYQYYDLYLRVVYNKLGAGVRSTLSKSDLLNLPLLVPDLEEQNAIVNFLDSYERLVKQYIRGRQAQIKLLNQQKQVIIQDVVTRGLDSSVALKSSDIDWLDKFPQNWKTHRLKNLFTEIDDKTKTGTETLLSLRMYQGLVPHNTVSNKPITSKNVIGFKRTRPNEIVMNRMRAASGLIAVTPMPGIVSPDYAIFRQIVDLNPDYFVHLFKTPLMRAKFRSESKGLGTGQSGFLRLYSDRFGIIKVPVPPIEEQNAFVAYLEDELRELNRAIEKINDEVELIREYRTRLISDVVTGKLDVREAAKNLPEIEPLGTAESELSEEDELSDELEETEEMSNADE